MGVVPGVGVAMSAWELATNRTVTGGEGSRLMASVDFVPGGKLAKVVGS